MSIPVVQRWILGQGLFDRIAPAEEPSRGFVPRYVEHVGKAIEVSDRKRHPQSLSERPSTMSHGDPHLTAPGKLVSPTCRWSVVQRR